MKALQTIAELSANYTLTLVKQQLRYEELITLSKRRLLELARVYNIESGFEISEEYEKQWLRRRSKAQLAGLIVDRELDVEPLEKRLEEEGVSSSDLHSLYWQWVQEKSKKRTRADMIMFS